MDRLALLGSFFFTLLIATNGSMTSASVLARKGHNPRLGAVIGWLVGAAGGMIPALLILTLADRGSLAVLASVIGSLGALIALWHLTPDRAQQGSDLPSDENLRRNIVGRHVRGTIMKWLFIGSIAIALITLGVLLWTIINKSVGLVAMQYAVQPDELVLNGEPTGRELEDLAADELQAVLAENVRVALLRVYLLQNVVNADQDKWADLSPQLVSEVLQGKDYPAELADLAFNKLDETQAATLLALNLDRGAVEDIIFDEVIQPEVVEGWSLWASLTDRDAIAAITAVDYPDAELEWRSWVSWEFLSSPLDPRKPDDTGIRPGLKGSLLVIAFTILVAFPVGVGAAIYLEEYATDNWLNRVIQTNINNLAGVPSIIYGMLGLAIFVRLLE
ncbi:MAG: hypothetical protein JXA10_01445, partial [Anaerolineae bacterium]|nr:hypothetical protein [Anaerolineae bacterium]